MTREKKKDKLGFIKIKASCFNWALKGASQVVLVVKNPPAHQCKRHKTHRFNPWVGKTPWRKAQ